MKSRLPTTLVLIAALQFIAPLVLPPSILKGISPALWALIAFLFAALGLNLVRRRAWSRLATIFIQGFSIIVRLLVIVGHARPAADAPLDVWLLGTTILSMALSAMILYAIDTPEVQMVMQ